MKNSRAARFLFQNDRNQAGSTIARSDVHLSEAGDRPARFTVDWLDAIPRLGGIFSIASGAITLIGWYAHSLAIIQIVSNFPPMQYNTALGFILSGLALFLLTTRRSKLASWPALAAMLLGAVTLVEYATGRSLGLDELFFKSYFQMPGTRPGQMSPLTAACFSMIGAAIAISCLMRSRGRLITAGLFACIAAIIPCLALFGYFFGIETANGWGVSTRMAVLTAPTFLILTGSLVFWAWQQADRENLSFIRWLPITASVTLMAMIALTAGISFTQLKSSSDLRKHSYDVLAVAHGFLADIYDTTRGMRAYVMTGQSTGLDTYQAGSSEAPKKLLRLAALVKDNPGQEARRTKIARDFDVLNDYAARLIDLRKTQGLEPAIQLESTGEGFIDTSTTLTDLRTFISEEQRLLETRSTAADGNLQNTARLLLFGSVLAAILVVVANSMASREVESRRRAELELRKAASYQKVILTNLEEELRERRQLEKSLFHQGQILDLVNDTIFIRTLDDKITYWNQGAQRVYGWEKDEVIGRVTHSLLKTKFSQPREEIMAQLMARDHWEGEMVHTRRDGGSLTVLSRWTLQRDEGGAPARIIEMNFDITDRKNMERALHEKNLELQAVAQAKNSFLANMSHELRTPLNGIIGFSEILVDGLPGKINAEQKEYLGDILNSGQHLLQLINDVLDLAKVESGKMEVYPESFLVSEAIKQVCSVAYPLLQKKRIKLVTTFSPTVDRVMLDQKKVKQILYNLLSNAVKFTAEGGLIEISTESRQTTHFSLAVRDTGIGIRSENMERLFHEFEQLDEGTTRRYQGTGLGLALTRKIAEVQRGRVEVDSVFGQGTTFTVVLPLTLEKALT